MLTDEQFAELFDHSADLVAKDGKSYIEIGTKDPDADPDHPVDATPLRMHVELIELGDAENEDFGNRKAIMLRLPPTDGMNRIYIDPAWITRIEGMGGRAMKVWIHDAFYVGLSG